MEAAKFSDVHIEEIPCVYAPASPTDVFDMMRKSMVRATYLYERQTPAVQQRIEQAITEEAAKALAQGQGKIACSAFVVSGMKGG
jgi:hypothetical protein